MRDRILTDRELIQDLVRHEFTQFRDTKHGVLWGMRTYRFLTPRRELGGTGNFTGGGSPHHAEARTREWTKLKTQMYGDMPGYKARIEAKPNGLLPQKDQPIIQVVSDPIDILAVDPPNLLTGVLRAQGAADLPVPPGHALAQTLSPTPKTRNCWVCHAAVPRPEYDAHIAQHDRETAPPPAPVAPERTTPAQAPPAEPEPAAMAAEEETMPDEETSQPITERDVRLALAASGGNRSAAADALRVSRSTIQRLIGDFGIDVPLATSWVCPYCRAEFKAQGKHLDFCPAAKAANRARNRMERDRHQQTMAARANPTYVAPHVRPAPPTPAERTVAEARALEAAQPTFSEVGRPLPSEPNFRETARPTKPPVSSPLLDAVLRTAETGGAVCLTLPSAQGKRLVARLDHHVRGRGFRCHSRRVNDDLYLWVERRQSTA